MNNSIYIQSSRPAKEPGVKLTPAVNCLRKNKKKKLKELAEILELEIPKLSDILAGQRYISISKFRHLMSVLGAETLGAQNE